MDTSNRYAPSAASLLAGTRLGAPGGVDMWRTRHTLLMLPNAVMPPRCVKCNRPADQPTKARKIYWYSPWLYLLLIFNVIVFAIVARVVRKKAVIAPGLCAEHKKRRRTAIGLGWMGVLSGFVLMFAGMNSSIGVWGALLGIAVVLGSIAASMIFARILYAERIDIDYLRLKGCKEPFLETLPPFPG